MKTRISFIFLFFLSIHFSSCTNTSSKNTKKDVNSEEIERIKTLRDEIAKEIEDANASIANKDLGNGFFIKSTSLDDNKWKTYYMINEVYIHLDSISKHKDLMQDVSLSWLFNDKEKREEVFKKIVEAEIDIQCIFEGDISGKTIMFETNHKTIKEELDKQYDPIANARKRLASSMAVANASCPIRQDEVSIMTSATFDDENVVYSYIIEEEKTFSLEDKSLRNELRSAMREVLVENFRSPEFLSTSKDMIDLCTTLNCNLIYKYKGNKSGKHVEVIFTPKELSKIL